MNKLETIIYNVVRKNPALKQIVRNLYQSFFDAFPRKKNEYEGIIDFKENFFFGFHDVSPFSMDETKILANHCTFDLRMPQKGDSLEIGYFDLKEGKFGDWHKIGESYSWNYHKGCRLQWLHENKLIFNTSKEGKLISKVVDVREKTEQILPCPIDAVFHNENELIATSFSYERLERCMPGYGYPYQDNGQIELSHPQNTGLYLLDIRSGECSLIVSLDDLANESKCEKADDYLHFVTHTEFSHDGRYVAFLYRRIPRHGDYMKRWTQIKVYDRNTSEIYTMPSQDSGSHYVWNEKNQIIASCIIDGNSCHVLFDMNDLNHPKCIAPEVLNSDGHQSFVSDTVFITDTYPDRRRMAKLFRVNIDTGEVKTIARVYSPKQFQTKDFMCHIACDLHPRTSRSGDYVCFDSPTSGARGLYVMSLGNLH